MASRLTDVVAHSAARVLVMSLLIAAGAVATVAWLQPLAFIVFKKDE